MAAYREKEKLGSGYGRMLIAPRGGWGKWGYRRGGAILKEGVGLTPQKVGESQTTSEHLSFIITIHGSNKRKVKIKHQTHLSKSP